MNRRSFLQTAATLTAPLAYFPEAVAQAPGSPARSTAKNGVQSESVRRIEAATAAAMAMQRRDWEQGILAQAMLEADDRQRTILLTKAAMVQKTPDGRLGVVVSGSPTDPAMGGAAYAKAAEWTGDKQIQQAVDGLLAWIRKGAPRNADGILYHVFRAPEMWSDGFNCAPPFLAARGFYDEAMEQIEGYRNRLWNPDKKLLAHIWDDQKKQLRDANFWGGGNGWAAAGLARVWRSLPNERQQERERVADFARQLIDGCLACQRPDGLFHNVVDQPSTFVETNLAQMLAFAIYEGVSAGWLPAAYLTRADRMRAAARLKMDADGFVQGACGAPSFDRPGPSTEAQAFCIMMEAAGSR
ncbi:MAG: glycoside hydrolase family 88 protein [Acidobacteriaceae bacterium]